MYLTAKLKRKFGLYPQITQIVFIYLCNLWIAILGPLACI